MPVTLTSTGITFSDGNSQNTAASAGAGIDGTNVQTFNNSTNAAFPSTATAVIGRVAGGGGGGSQWQGDGTGGVGGGAFGVAPRAALGSPFSITVGGGGAPSPGFTQNRAGAGGQSKVGNLIVANGGNGSSRGPNQGNPGNGVQDTFCVGNSPLPFSGNGGFTNGPQTINPGNPGAVKIAFIG